MSNDSPLSYETCPCCNGPTTLTDDTDGAGIYERAITIVAFSRGANDPAVTCDWHLVFDGSLAHWRGQEDDDGN